MKKTHMREIYFDNSSTTQPSEAVRAVVMKTMTEDYGNPSSMHQKGVEAEGYLKKAQETLARILKVRDKEIFFTSGGTESNNWALIGTALAKKRQGNTIITTTMEHPAVSEPLKFLEDEGFQIVRVPLKGRDGLDLEALDRALNNDVILVTIMAVNNEIGAVMPLKKIGQMIREKAPQAVFHVDGTQAFGHYRLYPKDLKVDMLSASAHKFHGPKGIGFLYIDSGVKIRPFILGGGQQMGMRSGTDNVPGAAGMAVAAREAYEAFDERNARIAALKKRLIAGLEAIPDVVIHSGWDTSKEDETFVKGGWAPHIVNAAFIGVGSEVLLHTLEDRGIYISAGSACSTHKRAPSPTLSAIGAGRDELSSSVRFSFSHLNTEEEVDFALTAINEVLPLLRRYRAH